VLCRWARRIGAGALLAAIAAHVAAAQGVATAAVAGTVTAADGRPVDGAVVDLTNTANGQRWETLTRASGRYVIENVQVSGPYVIDARAVGFRPMRRGVLTLALGQRFIADFVLVAADVELTPLTVTGESNRLDATRADPALAVSAEEIARLPNLDRDLASLAALSPFVTLRPLGGVSVAGQNELFNRFQVDGGVEQDLYYGRSPGGPSTGAALPEVLPRALSLEAVQEFQVLVAPFDVRYGDVAGGLLNAVTRSGTNTLHGSAFAFFQNDRLTGADAAGNPSPDFTTWQFGGTTAGPIVKDRAQFFVSADLQHRVVPDPGPLVTDTTGGNDLALTGVSYASAVRFQSLLADSFGLAPGGFGPSNGTVPAADVFAKVTMQLGTNSHLEVSQHVAHGDRRGFIDVGRAGIDGAYALTSVSGAYRSTAVTTRATWRSLVAHRAANEVTASRVHLRDACIPSATLPHIETFADDGKLVAGPDQVCPTSDVTQNALELTDNVTFVTGAHALLFGAHGARLHFVDPLLLNSAGRWSFDNLDALDSGRASHYDRGIPLTATPPVADFHVVELGAWAQDRWTLSRRVEVTAGLRVDLPILPDTATTNDSILAIFGLDTGTLPASRVRWSPRLAFTADLSGSGSAILHGGVGVFGGPPPWRWLSNGYRDNGLQDALLTCDPPFVPVYDPTNQPTACPPNRLQPRVSAFDPRVQLPRTVRAALGLDHRVWWAADAGLDLLYTRALSQFTFTDANLRGPVDTADGEGGRLLYGTIDAAGRARPARLSSAFGRVIRMGSRSGDDAVTAAIRLRKTFAGDRQLYLAYAWSLVHDRMSLVNFAAQAQLNNAPLDGTLEDRNLRPSLFDTPHRVTVVAASALPWRTHMSLLYTGTSGSPFTYVVDGDANADGLGGAGTMFKSDVIYLPRVSAAGGDIQLARGSPGNYTPAPASDYAALDGFIADQPCLDRQRGHLMQRNSCRNGWSGLLSARLATTLPAGRASGLTLILDVFNVPNLINAGWGRRHLTTTGASLPILRLIGWSAGRGVYQLALPPSGGVDDPDARWRMQLSARYDF
jgi:carboxypeptidase family protein